MSATQYTTIETKLLALIDGITEIQQVYGYRKGDLNGFPACCLEGFSSVSDFRSQTVTERTMVFNFRVYQEAVKDGVGAAEAESRINTIIDKLLNAFDTDWTLTTSADSSLITRMAKEWVQDTNFMRVLEFDVTVKKLYDLNT